MLIAEVVKALEQAELHVVDVAAILLRACRVGKAALDRAFVLGSRSAYAAHVDLARRLISEPAQADEPEFLEGHVLAELRTFIDRADDDDDALVRIRALATVLDERRGAYFFHRFAGVVTPLPPNSPVPTGPREVIAEELGGPRGISTDPDRREGPVVVGVPVDAMKRLRLSPLDLDKYSVVFDARGCETIDAMFGPDAAAPQPDMLWAAAVPTAAALEDFTFDVVDTEPPGFFKVRPNDEIAGDYPARLLAVLDRARAARIIVIPELCLDAAAARAVATWFHSNPSVSLLVAGSQHVLVDDKRRNRARIFIRGARGGHETFHDKFSEFAIVVKTELIEAIDHPNRLTIVAGSRWSFCTLICKDFALVHPRRIVADLRVRTVLVPAMSPKTDLFVVAAKGLAQEAHCLVFIANAPHEAADHTAIFAMPRRAEPLATTLKAAVGVALGASARSNEFDIL